MEPLPSRCRSVKDHNRTNAGPRGPTLDRRAGKWRARQPVCIENPNPNVVVMESARDGVRTYHAGSPVVTTTQGPNAAIPNEIKPRISFRSIKQEAASVGRLAFVALFIYFPALPGHPSGRRGQLVQEDLKVPLVLGVPAVQPFREHHLSRLGRVAPAVPPDPQSIRPE